MVKSLCSTKPAVVGSHQETLSLIVRSTAEGHGEIDKLLGALRNGNEPTIRLTFQPLGDPSESNLKSLQTLPEEEKQRFQELLLGVRALTPDEAREVTDLHAKPAHPLTARTVRVVAGRKTSWN